MQAIGPYHFHNASTSMSLKKQAPNDCLTKGTHKKTTENHVSTDNVWLQT